MIFRLFAVATFLSGLFFLQVFFVSAQNQTNDTLIVTWRANTLFPSDYQGKAFPGPRSSVTASAEVYRNGKWIDTSRANFTWMLDEKIIGRGEGIGEFSFRIPARPDLSVKLKATVMFPDTGLSLNSFSSIPVMGPQVVLNAPFPEKNVAPQSRFTLEAIPYFWNVKSVSNLLFSWTANTMRQSFKGQSSITFTVGAPTNDYEKELQATILLQNPEDPTEFAKDYVQLNIQSQ